MSLYERNDGRFPDVSEVWTPYSLLEIPEDRDEWPWLRGTVLGQCGPDEWHIRIDMPELIEHGDGYEWSPACFRNSCELRPVHNTYAVWHAFLRDQGYLIDNDGRLPDGTDVWTRFIDGGESDLADYLKADVPATYCAPDWPWYRGRILGQADTGSWLVLLELEEAPFLCRRNIADIAPVLTGDGE